MKCSISNIANVISESIPNPAESGFDIFVGLEHYDSGEVKVTRYGSTQNLVTAVKVFRKGDILLARRNVYLKRAGLVDFDGVTSGDSIVLRVKDDLSSLSLQSEDIQMYLPFVLNTEEFWNYAEKYSDGTMSKRLSPKTLLQYEFDIPDDVTEKNRLLWQAYKTKESYKAMITATDEMVKSQFIEMFGTPDNHPAEYAVKNLGELSECYAGATPSTKVKEYWENGTISWMSSGEVHMGHVTETESKITDSGYKHASTKMVPVHSVVIALAGQGKTRGTVAITEIPLCTNQSLCAIVPSKDIHYEYLYHNLKGRYLELRGMAGDVNGRGGLNLKIVQSIRVIVPPLSEQMRFVGIAQQADKSKFELKQAIERIDKVMRALMQ